MLGDDHPDMRAMIGAISDAGGPEPIKITADNYIADGRHRTRCCEILGYESMPVVMVAEKDVHDLVITSLLARRHMTKWQIAYTLAPLLEKAADSGKKNRSNLPEKMTLRLAESTQKHLSANTQCLSEFLKTIGVEKTTWIRVQSVRKVFADRDDLRKRFEPALFSGDPDTALSLEGVNKALGSIIAYEEGPTDPKGRRDQHDRLAVNWVRKLTAQMKEEWWDAMGVAERRKVAVAVADAAATWPDEVRAAVIESLGR
jgi:hypothetical protein